MQIDIQPELGRRVAVAFAAAAQYPSASPFHPSEAYPEYPFKEVNQGEPNHVYAAVRSSFQMLGLDAQNVGSKHWNPLGDIVKPGDCVLLKPNFIKEHRTDKRDEWIQIITHGSIIRAVADYVYIALQGKGRIIVADGPQTDSDFDKISRLAGLSEIRDFYAQFASCPLEVYDLRNEKWVEQDGVYTQRVPLAGDPAGTLLINLADRSRFEGRQTNSDFYGAFYDVRETNRFHSNGQHSYAFCRTPLLADVVIHLPKLKTHKKCGITVNLKGNVGLNGNKNLLPHYCFGSPGEGGDQFPGRSAKHRLENILVKNAKNLLVKEQSWALHLARRAKHHAYRMFGGTSAVVRSGNWHGNDTVWRMALDLFAILTYADGDGVLHDTPQRRFFSMVDGIIAGEANGPMEATAKPCGMVIAGHAPVLVDAVCARVMGFDYRKIPLIAQAFCPKPWALVPCTYEEVQLCSNRPGVDSALFANPQARVFQFEPHFGWKGHIELEAIN